MAALRASASSHRRLSVDAVIGNPPYAPIAKDIMIDTSDYLFLRKVKDSGSNLFIAAMYRVFDLIKSNETNGFKYRIRHIFRYAIYDLKNGRQIAV